MIITKKIKNSGILAFFLLLTITVGVLSYQNASVYSELKEAFEVEKIELESELNSLIKDYEDAAYSNGEFSSKLRDKLNKIIKLKDTINNLKANDYGLFRFYRKRISNLAEQNKILFTHIDSLSSVNNLLHTKNDSVNYILVKKDSLNEKLKYKNNYLYQEKRVLKEKIAVAETFDISRIKVTAMKKKRSGKHTSTSRSSRTDAFKVEFDLLENKVISPGNKSIYIQITNDNKVISPSKKVRLKNKEKILCNDILVTEYHKKQVSVISFINVNRDDINKGSYKVNAFVDGIFVGNTSIKLK